MPDFGAGAFGRQPARARRDLPLAVTGAAQLHPEAMRLRAVAFGFDLQALRREACAQSLRRIVSQPIFALFRFLIEAIGGRRDGFMQRGVKPPLFEMIERGLPLQGRQRIAGSRSRQPQSEQSESERQTKDRQSYRDSFFHELYPLRKLEVVGAWWKRSIPATGNFYCVCRIFRRSSRFSLST